MTHEQLNEKMNELVLKISNELSILNTQMKSVLETMLNHDKRISELEKKPTSIKDDVIMMLIRALIASIGVIAVTTGSSAIIKQLFGL